jgi:predicted PurR-regulated permease PerM
VAITYDLYRRLAKAWQRPRLAALAMTLATGFVILVPAVAVLFVAAEEFYQLATAGFSTWIERFRESLPNVHRGLEEQLARLGTSFEGLVEGLRSAAPGMVRPVAAHAWNVVEFVALTLVSIVVMLVTQYFVYAEARRLRGLVHDMSPLGHAATDRILETLRATTAAAVLGGLLVALVQGALAGIGFTLVGLRAPILWGMVTALASLFPFGGAALVWAPAVLILFATGGEGRAWFLLAWGVLLVSTVDNFLRPFLLRRAGARVHPMLLFFAVISGIGLFGMSGIVFGPLLIALLMTVAKIYREHVAPQLAPLGAGAVGVVADGGREAGDPS